MIKFALLYLEVCLLFQVHYLYYIIITNLYIKIYFFK
nr:MAG TPA: hypothetical protein [Bacteriophage sp.]